MGRKRDADDLLRALFPDDETFDEGDLSRGIEPLDGMTAEEIARLEADWHGRRDEIRRQKIVNNAASERGVDEPCPLEELLFRDEPPGGRE